MKAKVLTALEYDKVLRNAAAYCHSARAAASLCALLPASDYDRSLMLLDMTAEADRILYEYAVTPELSVCDIDDCLEKAEKMSVLTIEQVRRVGEVLRVVRVCRSAIQTVPSGAIPLLYDICNDILPDADLEKRIFESISGDNELSDNASSDLRHIRGAIKAANAAVRAKLNSYLSGEQSKYLQESLITLRNGRYVLPVKAECRSAIPGLLHDRSASGATIYIEPYAVVEMNNEIKSLCAQEEAETERILQAFTSEIHSRLAAISRSYDAVIQLDCIFAKASYAKAVKAVKPEYNNDGILDIRNGRHPLIDKEKVVPVSVKLGTDYNILIISGPNTGGKTVTLKLCGLFALMAAAGLFLPCEEGSRMCCFSGIYCDIGDEQSIESSLSTFSSHIVNLASILKNADGRSLVLLDEVGAGTDPQEGSALAVACIEYLLHKGCRCIATSHFDELKNYSADTPGVMNASMDFDPLTFAPTYRLLVGVAGSSNALEIAGKLGLPEEIISRAGSLISPDKLELNRLTRRAEGTLREAQEQLESARAANSEAEKRLALITAQENEAALYKEKLEEKLRKGYRELLSEYAEEAEELIEEIKEKVKKGDEQALFEARTLKNKVAGMENNAPRERVRIKKSAGEISEGDDVYVKTLGKVAKVIAVNAKKREYTVKAGVLTTIVPYTDVFKAEVNGGKKEDKPRVVYGKEYISYPQVGPELDLRGQRCDEAVYNADVYLGNAALSGLHEVRIIHGKGSGALRSALREMLVSHPRVASFRTGKYGEGDNGVTVVTLR